MPAQLTLYIEQMPMSIIRVVKRSHYMRVMNAVFLDSRLSWEARGLLGYLLSKPDNWQVRVRDIIVNGPARAKKVRRMLKELEKHGYLVRQRVQQPNGKLDWISLVYESPSLRHADC